MTLPEAIELLDYFSENPPTHRALAIIHQFKKVKPAAMTVDVSPELLQQLAPGGMITSAMLAGIPQGVAPPNG